MAKKGVAGVVLWLYRGHSCTLVCLVIFGMLDTASQPASLRSVFSRDGRSGIEPDALQGTLLMSARVASGGLVRIFATPTFGYRMLQFVPFSK